MVDQTSSFVVVRRITSAVKSVVDECPPRAAVFTPWAAAPRAAPRGHPLVRGAPRGLGPADPLRAGPPPLTDRDLGDGPADAAFDPLGAEGALGVARALTPLLRAVGVAHRHPHDRDRRVHAPERH